jgi:hypothetical protein
MKEKGIKKGEDKTQCPQLAQPLSSVAHILFPPSPFPAQPIQLVFPPVAQLHRRPVPALPFGLLSRAAHPAWPAHPASPAAALGRSPRPSVALGRRSRSARARPPTSSRRAPCSTSRGHDLPYRAPLKTAPVVASSLPFLSSRAGTLGCQGFRGESLGPARPRACATACLH